MNQASRQSSYTATQRSEETPRETEARALLSCASRLDAACKPDCSEDEWAAAIKHNQQLWTIFQVCLCEKENPLPSELKGLLLNLSTYIDKVSMQALTERKPGLLQEIISINRNIAAGLSVANKNTQDSAVSAVEEGKPISVSA